MKITNECQNIGLAAVCIFADSVVCTPSSPEQSAELSKLVSLRKGSDSPAENIRKGVRALLRRGGFRPAGRSKPASEYLFKAVLEDNFPYINNLVDINNYLSLYYTLPMSLLDRDVTGDELILRLGREGEKYVFNRSGQEIDISSLISVCSPDEAFGNPVKDSMKAKTTDTTRNVIGVVYAPEELFDKSELSAIGEKFAAMLVKYAQAEYTRIEVV